MRTLHVGLRVSNLDSSLAFYRWPSWLGRFRFEMKPS